MNKKIAVFSCLGLGDGLIALVLANNLALNGFSVRTFHPFLEQLQSWFPELPIAPFPEQESLADFDQLFFFYEKSPWMQKLIAHAEAHFPKKTTVLNPIATPKTDYKYWENGRFNGTRPFVHNLETFCKNVLHLPATTLKNGIAAPASAVLRKFPRRVVLHATSSRPGKNWPLESFLQLSQELRSEGYEPAFIFTEQEKKEAQIHFDTPVFPTLSDLAQFVAESGYMIGNDSGIGHLASCLGLPTLTICRNRMTADFWRPSWSPGRVLTPSPWIPNLKGLRLRDKHWQKWISVRKAAHEFFRLVEKN